MSSGTYSDFLSVLGHNESGNNYSFVSSLGYLGRFQFGEEALKAIGFYDGDATAAIDFAGSWTATAATFGVFNASEFLASSAAQDAAGAAWFMKIGADLDGLDLGRFDGQTVDGIPITTSGLLAGAHLVGVWALKDFLESGGAVDTKDGYGTPVSQYVQRFGGFDTPVVLKDAPVLIAGGGSSALQVIGSGADDTLSGGVGPNLIRGGAGNDVLHGGASFDDINGNQGDDTIDSGAGGGDWLVGGQGDDLIHGEGGHEVILGNLGADTLVGGGDADVLRGGQGADSIVAGAGAEWISGDLGSDTIQAGSGADTFHAFAQSGIDRIVGFKTGVDHVMVDPGTHYTLSQVGADTVVDMGGGNEVILTGTTLSSLTPGWIIGG